MIAMSHSMTDHKKHATHQKQTNLIKSISLISPLRTIDESARLPVTAYCLWQQCATVVHSDTVCHSVTAACHGQMTRQICVAWKYETPSDSPFSLLSISFRIGHLSRSRPLKRVWWICGMIFVEPQLKLLFSISEYSLCLAHELS